MSLELLDRIRIVLVEPTHPGNIGSVARAMKNMGLSRLELVAPRSFPGPEATARAANATDILDGATVHRALDPALEGATLIIGTSARTRRIPWPLLDPRACAERSIAELGGSADAAVAIQRVSPTAHTCDRPRMAPTNRATARPRRGLSWCRRSGPQ